MPAYRSSAEAEIREPAVARLRELMPGCRIIYEIQNICQGPNRIDVLAVTENRIAAIEVKSKKDKLDRLPSQIAAMRGSAHHAIAALHAKFFEVAQYQGRAWAVPDWKLTRGAVAWGFGFTDAIAPDCDAIKRPLSERYEKHAHCLPSGALQMLWVAELREIASRRALSTATSRLTMPELHDLIRWHLTGADVTREVCAALRARKCIEADPEIAALPAPQQKELTL